MLHREPLVAKQIDDEFDQWRAVTNFGKLRLDPYFLFLYLKHERDKLVKHIMVVKYMSY